MEKALWTNPSLKKKTTIKIMMVMTLISRDRKGNIMKIMKLSRLL